MATPVSEEVKTARLIERLRNENTQLRSLNRKLLKRGGGYDDFLEELQSLLAEERKYQKPHAPVTFKKHKSAGKAPINSGHSETATYILSDWHTAETVREEESCGFNKFNSVILANRVYHNVQKAKSIIRLHQSMYKVEQVWLPILGDMMNGSIHPEFITSNDLSDAAAAILTCRLLRMTIDELRALEIPIKIDCIIGNHPRMTVKFPTKRHAYASFDWMIYESLADCFSSSKDVKVTVHTGQMARVKIYDWHFMLEHGVGVKNGKEEDLEDRIRALFDDPTYRQSHPELQGPSFDQILMGNLHKAKLLERTVVNGTLVGQNELGVSWRLKPIRALQTLFGTAPHHPRTWVYQVDSTEIKSEKADNPFSKYAVEFLDRHGR